MVSLQSTCFLYNRPSLSVRSWGISPSLKGRRGDVVVRRVAVGPTGKQGDRNGSILTEAAAPVTPVIDLNGAATVDVGVGDVYGEDSATEDQHVTPWAVSVARLNNWF
ncbi:hypothetical protein Droror1_Dr00009892 [Drosera rotundifolia]